MDNFTEPSEWTDAEVVANDSNSLDTTFPIKNEVDKILNIFNAVSDEARLKFVELLVIHSTDNIKTLLKMKEQGILNG